MEKSHTENIPNKVDLTQQYAQGVYIHPSSTSTQAQLFVSSGVRDNPPPYAYGHTFQPPPPSINTFPTYQQHQPQTTGSQCGTHHRRQISSVFGGKHIVLIYDLQMSCFNPTPSTRYLNRIFTFLSLTLLVLYAESNVWVLDERVYLFIMGGGSFCF